MVTQAVHAVYADYNATSPLRPQAKAALVRAYDAVGNPSSVHAFGRHIRGEIETARKSITHSVGLPTHRLAFTSGASEALATALSTGTQFLPLKRYATRLLIAASDHVAALHGHRFQAQDVDLLSVDKDGLIDCVQLEDQLANLAQDDQALVCVHAANNETGILQPIADIARLCQTHKAVFVCDLAQWAGRVPLDEVVPDIAIVSAHKIGGPAGVGALIFDPRRVHFAAPLIQGGGQERGVRAGTENHAGIAGFAAAIAAAGETLGDEYERLQILRDAFEAKLLTLAPRSVVFGAKTKRLPNTSCFAIPGHEAAIALMRFDLDGIAVSSGSACSSGKVKPSHVLQAMGINPQLAACALRLSLGFQSSADDVDAVLASIARWPDLNDGTV